MPICPYCEDERTVVRETFTNAGTIVKLSCDHNAFRNPNAGLPLEWTTVTTYDPLFGMNVTRRVASVVDRRELIKAEVHKPEMSPDNSAKRLNPDLGKIAQPKVDNTPAPEVPADALELQMQMEAADEAKAEHTPEHKRARKAQ